jgi:peroxiredoxin
MMRLSKSLVMLSLMILTAFAATPKVGEKAPLFSLTSAKGTAIALKDYAGKAKVVLVFYRGDW